MLNKDGNEHRLQGALKGDVYNQRFELSAYSTDMFDASIGFIQGKSNQEASKAYVNIKMLNMFANLTADLFTELDEKETKLLLSINSVTSLPSRLSFNTTFKVNEYVKLDSHFDLEYSDLHYPARLLINMNVPQEVTTVHLKAECFGIDHGLKISSRKFRLFHLFSTESYLFQDRVWLKVEKIRHGSDNSSPETFLYEADENFRSFSLENLNIDLSDQDFLQDLIQVDSDNVLRTFVVSISTNSKRDELVFAVKKNQKNLLFAKIEDGRIPEFYASLMQFRYLQNSAELHAGINQRMDSLFLKTESSLPYKLTLNATLRKGDLEGNVFESNGLLDYSFLEYSLPRPFKFKYRFNKSNRMQVDFHVDLPTTFINHGIQFEAESNEEDFVEIQFKRPRFTKHITLFYQTKNLKRTSGQAVAYSMGLRDMGVALKEDS